MKYHASNDLNHKIFVDQAPAALRFAPFDAYSRSGTWRNSNEYHSFGFRTAKALRLFRRLLMARYTFDDF